MKQPPYEQMSRTDLLREIHSVQAALGIQAPLRIIAEELQVHQEEVRAQQSQILEAQHALEEARDRYTDLFDFAPVGYVAIDASGTIAEVNLATSTLLRTERQRLLGQAMVGRVAAADRRLFLEHLARCRDSQRTVQTRLKLRNQVGELLPVNLVSRRANVAPGRSIWLTAIIDLTEQERSQTERIRAQEEGYRFRRQEQSLRAEAEAKDRFLAMLSHELRTPLTPIVFSLGLLEGRDDLPDEVRETLSVIRRNAEIEAKLIDDLLDTSRIASGKLHLDFGIVDLNQVIEEVLDTSAAHIDASRLVVNFGTRAPRHHVQGDSTRLHQVLWNLVTNAVRHTPRGGCITISSVNETADKIKVTVEDKGLGIEPSLIERLFDPFSQGARAERKAGLGLGLAISKGIIEAHGGTIRGFSEGAGKGARFEIELATVEPDEPALRTEVASRADSDARRRILLVEDHADTAAAIEEVLGMHGCLVTTAHSFAEALSHRGREFDLLITDIGLPDGDGLDLLAKLAPNGNLHAIALSGYGAGADVRRSREAGFELHLTKPVEVAALVRAIDHVLSPIAVPDPAAP